MVYYAFGAQLLLFTLIMSPNELKERVKKNDQRSNLMKQFVTDIPIEHRPQNSGHIFLAYSKLLQIPVDALAAGQSVKTSSQVLAGVVAGR